MNVLAPRDAAAAMQAMQSNAACFMFCAELSYVVVEICNVGAMMAWY